MLSCYRIAVISLKGGVGKIDGFATDWKPARRPS
ncbi:hypothetical protein SALBM135S_07340 [Streptomyces alboniger]